MPDLHALHRALIEVVNDPRTQIGMRQDAELLLHTLEQALPLPPPGPAIDPLAALKRPPVAAPGTWMADTSQVLHSATATPGAVAGEAASGQPQGLQPVAAPIKRSEMQPLAGQVTDNGVQLEVILRAFLAGEVAVAELVAQMQGVLETNDLGKALHAKVRALVAWFLDVKGRVVAP